MCINFCPVKNASILVSYRLHATLPAVSFNTPVVNITYDERAESICQDLGILSESIKMVGNGSNTRDLIRSKIMSGGYQSSADKKRQAIWKDISATQKSLFDNFKSQIEDYVLSCKS